MSKKSTVKLLCSPSTKTWDLCVSSFLSTPASHLASPAYICFTCALLSFPFEGEFFYKDVTSPSFSITERSLIISYTTEVEEETWSVSWQPAICFDQVVGCECPGLSSGLKPIALRVMDTACHGRQAGRLPRSISQFLRLLEKAQLYHLVTYGSSLQTRRNNTGFHSSRW